MPSDSHRSGQLTFDPTTTQGPNGGGLGLASFLLGQVQSFAPLRQQLDGRRGAAEPPLLVCAGHLAHHAAS